MLLDNYTKQSPIIGVAGMGGGINSYIFLSSDGGYVISRSLRFSSGDSAYLNRTPSSAGNRRTYTWSGWVKRSAMGTGTYYFLTAVDLPNGDILGVEADRLYWYNAYSGAVTSTDKFRDPSAWYHIVFAVDSTQLTDSNRVKMYANGRQITSFSNTAWPSLNRDFVINTGVEHQVGRYFTTSGSDFHLADIHFIDGQALTPTDFGEYDSNSVWQPKEYAGTYGTNGFHLDFSDTSSSAALGTDSSGNGNTWTVNNLVAASGIGPGITSTVPQDLTGDWRGIIGIVPSNTSGAVAVFPDGGGIANPRGTFFWTGLTIGDTITWYGTATASSTRNVTGDIDETSVSVPGASLGSFQLTVNAASGSAKIDFNGTANCYGITPGPVSSQYNDALRDSPVNGNSANDTGAGGEITGNYATWNPLCVTTNNTLSNGNLEAAHTAGTGWTGNSLGSTYAMFVATMGVTSGKWYWEGTFTSATTGSVGIVNAGAGLQYYVGYGAKSVGYTSTYVYNNGFGSAVASMPSYAQGDIIGVAIDMDNGKLYFSKNGTFINSGNPAAGTGNVASGLTGETVFPAVSQLGSSDGISFTVNFGQRAFAYTAPSGYKALCTANLPEPTIADGSTAFDTVLYTGDGNSTQTITGLNFAPDLTWQKIRNLAGDHGLTDSVRGVSAGYLKSNSTDLETGSSTNGVSAFTSDGFTAAGSFNTNNNNWVTWAWDGGSSTVTNTDGSISSQVRANPSAGFSIVSYTGNGTKGSTIGHGLNAAPDFVLCKRTDASEGWRVGHVSPGWTTGAYLHVADGFASTANDNWWNNTAPTNSVITLGTYPNTSTGTYICYAFTPVEQYSSFGSYLGNGSTDGPFVYTGFAVNFLLLKCSTVSSTSWFIQDLKRGTTSILFAQLPNQETTLTTAYPLSNGFKVNGGNFNYINGSGQTYIYAAFAEHPFKTARAR
jgi:hypothetical protein